ncbi:MAG: hypothetical protein GQ574_21520 [Crocinitomix sp.]|nr:hypothetical protein [Crocinitomix sp.]
MTKKKKFIAISSVVIIVALTAVYFLTRPPEFNLDKLHIEIAENEYAQLEKFRENALGIGRLDRSPDDFVAADFQYNKEAFNGELRLKGDYLDHLKENKWSFRIKLDNAMDDGLQIFSVQNPASRGYLNSYVYHQILKEEGVLSNEFRFIELVVNGDSWGIYCLEEHLTSRMIASQNKPNGVLLKFSDNSFFAVGEGVNTDGLIKEAKIKVYGDAKKEKSHKKEISFAKGIIKDYQYRIDSTYNNFDAKQTGLYYALSDLTSGYHAMGWINIRFYFNFETQKMEPVGYDAYPKLEWGNPYLGKHVLTTNLAPFETKMIVYSALKNEAINAAYLKALERVTQANYIENIMAKHHDQLLFLEAEIQKEYTDYQYNYNFLIERGKVIRNALNN